MYLGHFAMIIYVIILTWLLFIKLIILLLTAFTNTYKQTYKHANILSPKQKQIPSKKYSTSTQQRTHVVHDRSPSFQRDALENCEHGKAEVVEIRDSIVQSEPLVRVLLANGTFLAFEPLTTGMDVVRIECYFACDAMNE